MTIPGLEIKELIGEGGTSTVWRAWDTANNRPVAVKILDQYLGTNGEIVRAFKLEEQLMEEVNHPGIIHAFDFGCVDGYWYLVMEYVDGYTFSDYLLRKKRIAEADCLLIAESVASALDCLWNDHHLVHCDIKPENIMINSSGEIKLLDLGIAQRHQALATDPEASEFLLGTPEYIAPEQIRGDVQLDCRADIYALGATLYHLSTGKILFPGYQPEAQLRAHCSETVQAPDPRSIRPELSEDFAMMIEAMLVKDRDNRLQSWSSVYTYAITVEAGQLLPLRATPGASSVKLRTV